MAQLPYSDTLTQAPCKGFIKCQNHSHQRHHLSVYFKSSSLMHVSECSATLLYYLQMCENAAKFVFEILFMQSHQCCTVPSISVNRFHDCSPFVTSVGQEYHVIFWLTCVNQLAIEY